MMPKNSKIICPMCEAELYSLTTNVTRFMVFEAAHFRPLGNMPEPKDGEQPAKCFQCGAHWTITYRGYTQIHTDKGWWPA